LDRELLILRGQKVLELEKFDYTLHPEAKKIIKSKATDYIPSWRSKNENNNESENVIKKRKLVSKAP